MKAASINDIKQELQTLPPKKTLELCLKLARFKKENKELLSYLLFEAHNEQGYVESIKLEMDEAFTEVSTTNWYVAKKSLRKILRSIGKYSKHTATKESEVEMIIHFCQNLQKSSIPYQKQKVLSTLYETQLKKLSKLVKEVHEDLQHDYQRQIEQLQQTENRLPVFGKILQGFRNGKMY
jgi:gas vesicle protein